MDFFWGDENFVSLVLFKKKFAFYLNVNPVKKFFENPNFLATRFVRLVGTCWVKQRRLYIVPPSSFMRGIHLLQSALCSVETILFVHKKLDCICTFKLISSFILCQFHITDARAAPPALRLTPSEIIIIIIIIFITHKL
jgi:hypothetical protein